MYDHFIMEHLDAVCSIVTKGDYFVSIDLQDAYFSIPIHRDHKKFLRFFLGGQLFQYNVLCFGLASAPRIFTKCTKPIQSTLRDKGLKITII